MSKIRDSILKQMLDLNLSINQVSKMVELKIPRRTVYAFLTGEKDTATKTASILMDTLGLAVKAESEKTIALKEKIMKTEKPKSFRKRIMTEWEAIGKPDWSPRELLGMCMLIDFDFAREGLNPAPTFRKYVKSKNYSQASTWSAGLKFSQWT